MSRTPHCDTKMAIGQRTGCVVQAELIMRHAEQAALAVQAVHGAWSAEQD